MPSFHVTVTVVGMRVYPEGDGSTFSERKGYCISYVPVVIILCLWLSGFLTIQGRNLGALFGFSNKTRNTGELSNQSIRSHKSGGRSLSQAMYPFGTHILVYFLINSFYVFEFLK